MLFGTKERSATARVVSEDAVLLGQDFLFVNHSVPLPDAELRSAVPPTDAGDWLLELHKEGGGVVRVLFAEEDEEEE